MSTQSKWLLPATLALGLGLGYLLARLQRDGPVQAAAAPEPARPKELPIAAKKPPVEKKAVSQKLNIVFMMADNLGYGEPGCYGGGILRGAATPRIDKLAA